MRSFAIVNGPNLNLVGKREPSIYGSTSIEEYLADLINKHPEILLQTYQSNIEGELINYLQSLMGKVDGIILNAGGYSHTSIAIGDTIAAINIPTIEVHISNVLAREEQRKQSFIASKCIGSISGLGLRGYELALRYFLGL